MLSAFDIRIGRPFVAKRGHGAVAGDKRGFVSEWPKLCCNRRDQLFMIALGEIGAPDGSLKQDIANKGNLYIRLMEHDMAGCVTRAMIHPERHVADGHGFAARQPAVGVKGSSARKAVFRRILGDVIDPKLVIDMWPFDGYAQALPEFIGRACVIGMTVGQQDFFDLAAQFFNGFQQAINITARINKRTFVGFRTPDDGAVLLQWSHRHDGGAKRWFGFGRGCFCVHNARIVVGRLGLLKCSVKALESVVYVKRKLAHLTGPLVEEPLKYVVPGEQRETRDLISHKRVS